MLHFSLLLLCTAAIYASAYISTVQYLCTLRSFDCSLQRHPGSWRKSAYSDGCPTALLCCTHPVFGLSSAALYQCNTVSSSVMKADRISIQRFNKQIMSATRSIECLLSSPGCRFASLACPEQAKRELSRTPNVPTPRSVHLAVGRVRFMLLTNNLYVF